MEGDESRNVDAGSDKGNEDGFYNTVGVQPSIACETRQLHPEPDDSNQIGDEVVGILVIDRGCEERWSCALPGSIQYMNGRTLVLTNKKKQR